MIHRTNVAVARIARGGVALAPWALSLYLHYWLEHREIWAVDMPYRGLLSVVLIASAMALSFFLHSVLADRARKNPRPPADSGRIRQDTSYD